MRSPSGSTRKANDAVEQREEQIDQRQHDAEQRGDADQLRQQLTGLRRKEARGHQSPKARDAPCTVMAPEGSSMESASSKHFDQQRRKDAGDGSGEDGFDRRGERGAGGGSDEAGQPAVGAKAGVGLAEADARDGRRWRPAPPRPRAMC